MVPSDNKGKPAASAAGFCCCRFVPLIFEKRFFVFIEREAFSQDVVNIVDRHKRVGIDALDDVFQSEDFAAADDAVKDIDFLTGKTAFTGDDRGAPVQFLNDFFGDFAVLFRDDHRRIGGVSAVLNEIDDAGADKHGDERVHRFSVIQIHERKGDNTSVDRKERFPHLPSPIAKGEAGDDIRTAGRAAVSEDDAEPRSDRHAGEQCRKRHVMPEGKGKRNDVLENP